MRNGNEGGLTPKRIPIRTPKDLGPMAEKLSTIFETEVVVVVGSQSILVGWPNAPEGLRASDEIDAYPANADLWEKAVNSALAAGQPTEEASERIFALCGEGSTFHDQWGFYVDGVNKTTSPLPQGWQERAVYKDVQTTRGTVTVVAPCPEDMIATKLNRLDQKDRDFAAVYHLYKPLDLDVMKARLMTCDVHPEKISAAIRFLDTLPTNQKPKPDPMSAVRKFIPDYPADTHCAFFQAADNSVVIRKWNEDMGVFYKVDNPLGPAISGKNIEKYLLDGRSMDKAAWSEDPRVKEAMAEKDDTSASFRPR